MHATRTGAKEVNDDTNEYGDTDIVLPLLTSPTDIYVNVDFRTGVRD